MTLNCNVALKLKSAREKYLPYNEKTLKTLVLAAIFMFAWLLIWALVLKFSSEILMERNYYNLRNMTYKERILWDLIPFNYRGTEELKNKQIITTILNCFVFAPFGVLFCYAFKKQNLLRDCAICFGCSVLIETMQLFTTIGNPATEDLLTNVVGCIIGHFLYQFLFKRLSLKQSVKVCAVFNVIFVAVTLFSFVTTAMAADMIYGIITRTW